MLQGPVRAPQDRITVTIRLLLIGSLLLAGATARAEDQPPLVPTRDAAITYRILSDPGRGDTARQVHVATRASTGMVRFEVQGAGGFALMDRKNDRMVLVVDAQRAYMNMPAGANGGGPQFLLDPNMKYSRGSRETVAGYPCTVWTVQSADGTGTVCITDDGLMLRASGTTRDKGMRGGLEATSVTFAPQPEALFTVPPGYRQVSVSQMLQGAKPPSQ